VVRSKDVSPDDVQSPSATRVPHQVHPERSEGCTADAGPRFLCVSRARGADLQARDFALLIPRLAARRCGGSLGTRIVAHPVAIPERQCETIQGRLPGKLLLASLLRRIRLVFSPTQHWQPAACVPSIDEVVRGASVLCSLTVCARRLSLVSVEQCGARRKARGAAHPHSGHACGSSHSAHRPHDGERPASLTEIVVDRHRVQACCRGGTEAAYAGSLPS